MADLNTTVGFTYSGTGLKQAEADLKRVAQTSTTTVQSMQRTSTAASRLGSAFNRMGPGIQNASFQLQDIIVQMQMGVPASRTLGQQLPQLLGGFGPLGAVLGVVAGGMASLIPLVFDFTGEAEDAGAAADRYKDALEAVADQVEKNIILQRQLNGTFEGDLVDPFVRDLETLEEELKVLEEGYRALTERRGEAFRIGGFGGGIQTGSGAAIEQQEKIEEKIAEIREARRAQTDRWLKENTLKTQQEIVDWEEEQAKRGLARVEELRRAREAAHKKRIRELRDVDELIRRSGGRGSLVSGGLSPENEAFIASSQYRTEKHREEVEERIKSEERWNRIFQRAAQEDMRVYERAQQEKARAAEQAADMIGTSFENAFASMIDGSKSASMAFKDMANSIISDIARIVIQQSVSKPIGGFLSSALSGFIGGGFSSLPFGGTTGQSFGDYLTYGASAHPSLNAKGGAFSNGVKMFANGGVVGGPTMFGMQNGMGMMGEAGPEAILPLKRGPGGNLGVEGTPPVVNVNIVNENGGEVETRQNGPNVEVLIKRAVAQDIKGGGTVYGAISKTFNIRPEVTRRA